MFGSGTFQEIRISDLIYANLKRIRVCENPYFLKSEHRRYIDGRDQLSTYRIFLGKPIHNLLGHVITGFLSKCKLVPDKVVYDHLDEKLSIIVRQVIGSQHVQSHWLRFQDVKQVNLFLGRSHYLPLVQLLLEVQDDPDSHVWLQQCDQGCGVDPSQLVQVDVLVYN